MPDKEQNTETKENKPENTPVVRTLQESERELSVRNMINTVFLTISDDDMYSEVLKIILKIMESKHGVFGYLDERGDLIVPTMTRTIWNKCQVPRKTFTFPHEKWGDSSWPQAIREKRIIYSNEPSYKTPKGHIAIQRHISLPIIHNDVVVGLIQVANKESDYSFEDLHLLKTIGEKIAPVLKARLERDRIEKERIRTEEYLKKSGRELRIRNLIANIFLTIPDEEMYTEVLKVILEALDSKHGVFGYLDERGDFIVPTMTRTIWDKCQVPQKTFTFPHESWGDSSWPRAIREKRIIYSNEASDNIPEGHIKISRHISLPIIHNNEVIGLIQIANKDTDYTEEDIGLSNTIARSIAPVLRARLERNREEEARMKAEKEKLLAMEEKAAILSAMGDGLLFLDIKGNILMVNQAFEKIIGYPEQELRNRNFGEQIDRFFEDEDAKKAARLFKNMLAGKDPGVKVLTWLTQDGKKMPVNITISYMRDDKGDPFSVIITVADISELKNTEEALINTNKELEAFSYSVSHDLRTPLRAIHGFSQKLVKNYANKLDDEGIRLIDVVCKNAKKMSKLIDDLLSFSRIGRADLILSAINMQKLAKEVYTDLKETLPGLKVKFILNELPDSKGDIAMLRQVFANLVSNAVKFTRENDKPEIEIGGKDEGRYLRYYVKDNGIGFDMKYVNKIFGVFQRLHSTAEFEGTGVGLAIVQRIIHKHKGLIWAEGKAGKGATIFFTLPK